MERSSSMEAYPKDKFHDVAKKILRTGSESDQDVYVTIGGRVLKGSEELGSCGVRDGSTVQVVRRLRGGGRHKDKKSRQRRSKPRAQRNESRSARAKRRATKVQRSGNVTRTQ